MISPKKQKKVKAWAYIVNQIGALASNAEVGLCVGVELGKPQTHLGFYDVVPCTITYSLPSKKNIKPKKK